MTPIPRQKKQSRPRKGTAQTPAVRKGLDVALKQTTEEKYRLLANYICDGIYILDTDGRFIFVNKVIEERSGIPADKFVGLHFSQLVASKDHVRVQRNFERVMRGEKVPPYQLEYTTADKTPLCVEVNSHPIYEEGQVIGLQGISRDITERKQAEDAFRKAHKDLEGEVGKRTTELVKANKKLKREIRNRKQAQKAQTMSEVRFRELADLLPEVVFEMSGDETLIYTNRLGFEKFGYSKKEFDSGLKACAVIAPEDRERLRKNIARLMKGMKLGLGEYMAQRKDESKFPVILHSNIIHDENNLPVGLRGIMVDITHRKRAEEKLLAYQEKLRSLASELSLAEERIRRHTATELHDSIGQTIAFAKMKLGALQKSVSMPSVSNALAEIGELLEDTVQNTRGLISELTSPVLYELGLVPAVESLVQEMHRKYGMRISIEEDRQPKLLADDVQVLLFQAVRELLVNVAKHSKVSDAKVSFLRAGEKIQIKVSDSGIGFDASHIGGNVERAIGFGLFSIHERLESIGGRLRVESEKGKGTQVSLTAPLEKSKG